MKDDDDTMEAIEFEMSNEDFLILARLAHEKKHNLQPIDNRNT